MADYNATALPVIVSSIVIGKFSEIHIEMIGRCNQGHIHPAATRDIGSLKVLEEITLPKEITEVSSSCFQSAQAIDQELAHCPMVFRIRFECPSESTTVDVNVQKPPLAGVEKSRENVANPVIPLPVVDKDANCDAVQDAITRLEAKIEKFEKIVIRDDTKDMMKFLVQFKNTFSRHIGRTESFVDSLTEKIDQLENRIAQVAVSDERIRRLETKLEELQIQSNVPDCFKLEMRADGADEDDAPIESHFQALEEPFAKAVYQEMCKLEDKSEEALIARERARVAEIVRRENVKKKETTFDASIKNDLQMLKNEIAVAFQRFVELRGEIRESRVQTSLIVDQRCNIFSKDSKEIHKIIDSHGESLLEFGGKLKAMRDEFTDQLQTTADELNEKYMKAKNEFDNYCFKTAKDEIHKQLVTPQVSET